MGIVRREMGAGWRATASRSQLNDTLTVVARQVSRAFAGTSRVERTTRLQPAPPPTRPPAILPYQIKFAPATDYASRNHTQQNMLRDNTEARQPYSQRDCPYRAMLGYNAKNNMKVISSPDETSIAKILRFALRPGVFKMTSMGRWLLLASVGKCDDILCDSNAI